MLRRMISAAGYQLVARLGGESTVWRSYAMKHPDIPVACKYLSLSEATLRRHPDRTIGALDEAKLLTRICHPNVVEVSGFFVHSGNVGIVMPMALGTLDAPPDPLPQGALSNDPSGCVNGLALGLAALREAGYRHGRLTGDHVLIYDDRLSLAGLAGALALPATRRSAPERFKQVASAFAWRRAGQDRVDRVHARVANCADPSDLADVRGFFDVAEQFCRWLEQASPINVTKVRTHLATARAQAPMNAEELVIALGLRPGAQTAPTPHGTETEEAANRLGGRSPASGREYARRGQSQPTSQGGAPSLGQQRQAGPLEAARPLRPPPLLPDQQPRRGRLVAACGVLLLAAVVGSGLGFASRDTPSPPNTAAQAPCRRNLEPHLDGALVGVGDVDGDGCNEAVYRSGHTVQVVDGDSVEEWRIGGDQGVALLGDWDCNGTATLAVYDPTDGWLWRFPTWGSGSPGVASRLGTAPGTPAPIDALVRISRSGGCDAVSFSSTPAPQTPTTTSLTATTWPTVAPAVDPAQEGVPLPAGQTPPAPEQQLPGQLAPGQTNSDQPPALGAGAAPPTANAAAGGRPRVDQGRSSSSVL